MASKQMSGESSRIKRIFTIAGIVFLLIMAFNMVVENLVYVRSRRVYDANMQSVEIMSQMNDRLSSINESIGMMAAGMSDQTTLDSIDQDLAAIDTLKDALMCAGGQGHVVIAQIVEDILDVVVHVALDVELPRVGAVMVGADHLDGSLLRSPFIGQVQGEPVPVGDIEAVTGILFVLPPFLSLAVNGDDVARLRPSASEKGGINDV